MDVRRCDKPAPESTSGRLIGAYPEQRATKRLRGPAARHPLGRRFHPPRDRAATASIVVAGILRSTKSALAIFAPERSMSARPRSLSPPLPMSQSDWRRDAPATVGSCQALRQPRR